VRLSLQAAIHNRWSFKKDGSASTLLPTDKMDRQVKLLEHELHMQVVDESWLSCIFMVLYLVKHSHPGTITQNEAERLLGRSTEVGPIGGCKEMACSVYRESGSNHLRTLY
jgi:hypothetical protein